MQVDGRARGARLRIGVKKLRYLAELAQPAFPDEIGALLDRLEPLQETLGELHDCRRARADRREVPGARRCAGPAGRARRCLRSEMAHREQQAAALADALGKLREDRVLESLRDAIC